jgi:hypothetical protein
VRSLRPAHVSPPLSSFAAATQRTQWAARLCTVAQKRPQLVQKPVTALVLRSPATRGLYEKPDKKEEAKVAKEKLAETPEIVSTSSSVHPLFSEVATPQPERDVHMSGGIKGDLVSVWRMGSKNTVSDGA